MVPSYVITPVYVTTKEMIACFTLSVILFCSNLQTFYLVYLYLGPYLLPASTLGPFELGSFSGVGSFSGWSPWLPFSLDGSC